MVIVVVGAMIYMFQTFGGTGDKIEGVAQKGSIITEINNIKDGVKIAARSGHIEAVASATTDAVNDLKGLATLSYFAEQINAQLTDADNANANVYNAISFGGESETTTGTDNKSAMKISLVSTTVGRIPGIFVDLADGSLGSNSAFLEAQIATDLGSIAYIDRAATTATAQATALGTADTDTALDKRTPALGTANATTLADGKFIIYFKDFGSDEVIK
jgi:hypothetical protein